MDVIVLAGGMGTRLKDAVPDVPKPMAPVKNKPFLEYLFNWLSQCPAIDRIIVATGYKSETIIEYFDRSFKGIPIIYVHEMEPLGTGGAIANALKSCISEQVLIVNGDTYFPIDTIRFKEFHERINKPVSIALKKMYRFDRYGTVEIAEGTIMKFNEKTACEEGLINGGIYLLNQNWFETQRFPDKFSFEKDILEYYVSQQLLGGKIFDDEFVDIGIPDDYIKAASIV